VSSHPTFISHALRSLIEPLLEMDHVPFRLLSLTIASLGLILLGVLSWLPNHFGKLGEYTRQNRRSFLVSMMLGFGLSLFTTPLLLRTRAAEYVLSKPDPGFFWGTFVVLNGLLVASWPNLIKFWERSRRTWSFQRPPAQYSHLGATFILYGILGALVAPFPPSASPATKVFAFAGLDVALWIGISWIISRRSNLGRILPTKRPATGFIFPDEPISDESQDLLHRTGFVKELAELIYKLPFLESFVISLNAPWGSGKTSILRLLSKQFKGDSDILLMEFEPWYYASEDALIGGFYAAVERTLREKYLLYDLKRQLSRFVGVLSLSPRSWPFGFKFGMHQDPDYIRTQIESFVEQTGSRFIVLIDDVDRLHSKELLALFKLVRLSARFKHTVFLLAFDQAVVVKALRKEALQSDFLDKVVQMQVELPPPTEEDIENFLWSSDLDSGRLCVIHRLFDLLEIDSEKRQRFEDEMVRFSANSFSRIIRTMRQAKRYMNALAATLPLVVGQVDLFDFCLVTALRVFFPGVYRDVWDCRYFYVAFSERRIVRALEFSVQSEKYRAQTKERTEKLLSSEVPDLQRREVALDILKMLFSAIERAFGGPLAGNRSEETDREEKRIDSPECFDRYFLFRGESNEIADSQIEILVEEWNAAGAALTEEDIASSLRRAKEQGQLASMLRKLLIFMRQIAPENVRILVTAIARSAELYSDLSERDLWPQDDVSQVLILRLLDRLAPLDRLQELFLEILDAIENTQLHFAVSLVFMCEPRRSRFDRIGRYVNISKLRERVAARLEEFYITRNGDLFSHTTSVWLFIVLQWGLYFDLPDATKKVAHLLQRKFEEKPECLGMMLIKFFPAPPGDFRLDESFTQFFKLVDPMTVCSLVEKFGDKACPDERSREIASRIRDIVTREDVRSR